MTTHNIAITVHTHYLSERSDPSQNYYVFSYTIRIRNNELADVQLLERHWKITDANNKTREVNGRGVVGVEPVIVPNKHFEYTSAAILDTPVGAMEGFYTMRSAIGEIFIAHIPAFSLADPILVH